MLASSKHKYSKTLAFPDTYYELIINVLQSVELFCAYTKTAAFVQMFAFFSGRFFTLIIEETIIFVFITMLSYPSMWVKLAAQVVVVVLNYIISKLFVFKNQ